LRYLSVADRSRYTLDPIKGSRFIATVAPAASEAEALATVRAVEAELSDARHHCWAYRLRENRRCRSSDAGEPGGSAGRPILAQIEGHDVFDVAVVVTRYFGGVKLGIGGLIRAYGGCAGKALDAADLVTVIATTALQISHAYSDTAAVDAVIGQAALVRRNARYDAQVHLVLDVPSEALEEVQRALIDGTAGRIQLSPALPDERRS